MKRVSVFLFLAVLVAFSTGCSSNFNLPWENNLLDPSRVPTREPLEIPPDFNVLPIPGKEGQLIEEKTSTTPESKQVPSANSILFNAPKRTEKEPLTRNEKEQLPDWMGSKKSK
ncbi:MAG: DUF3035 domain-containing protein [Magnetococcus sp. DMHC-6]